MTPIEMKQSVINQLKENDIFLQKSFQCTTRSASINDVNKNQSCTIAKLFEYDQNEMINQLIKLFCSKNKCKFRSQFSFPCSFNQNNKSSIDCVNVYVVTNFAMKIDQLIHIFIFFNNE